MLFKIAWRNLLRNKRRSLIVLTSIVVGAAALVMTDSIGRGFSKQMLHTQIQSHVSHIQIHKKGFNENANVHKFIPNAEEVEKTLKETNFVERYSKRTKCFGLLSSANASAGTAIIGVQPKKESQITNINQSIVKGSYLTGGEREIVIGCKMAEKLEVRVGDKVVAIASDIDGNVSNALFKVTGIFKTGNGEFDRAYIYSSLETAQEMLGIKNKVHEFAIITNDENKTLDYKRELAEKNGEDKEVLAYQELLPIAVSYLKIYDQTIIIIYVLIAIAVMFGVINTMLMSVFERVQEFGVIMSIGMNTKKVFLMVLEEALVLGSFGTLIGFAIGLVLYFIIAQTGLDLSVFSEGLSAFGMSSVIYPEMSLSVVLNSILVIPVVTVLASIYPALKAIKLQPTDAMRYV